MSMGLAGMGGAAGAGQAMETLFDQRMRAAQLQQQDEHFKAQQAQQDALTRLKAQEQADAIAQRLELTKQAQADRQEAAKHLNLTRIDAQLKEIPTDTPLSQPTVAGMTDAGITPERFAPTPIRPPAAGSDAENAPPASIAAPGQDNPPPIPGTVANSPMPGRVSFTRIPTAQELQHQKDNEIKAGDQEWRNSISQQVADTRQQVADRGPKEPTNSYQLQPEIDPATGKQTGRYLGYNTKTNSWAPVQGAGPASTKAAPGAADQAKTAQTTKEALDTLGQLDQSIDAAKDLIGPGHGRVSNIEQMIGDADPKIQALGVKMKAAKMRVDHAITGSVRAGASPVLLAQWDNIFANKVTPEGLKSGVQALREILKGDSTTSAPSGAKRTRYDLNGNVVP